MSAGRQETEAGCRLDTGGECSYCSDPPRASLRLGAVHLPRWRNWQTHYLEVVAPARVWRFESSPGHSVDRGPSKPGGTLLAGLLGSDTSGTQRLEGDQRIVRSLPCLTCGYDLRGLRLSGACPECSAPAAASLAHLSLAEPALVRSIRYGAMSIAIASMGWSLLYIGAALVAVLVASVRAGGLSPVVRGAFVAAALVVPLFGLYGWIRILLPALEPGTSIPMRSPGLCAFGGFKRRRRVVLGACWFAGLYAAVVSVWVILLVARSRWPVVSDETVAAAAFVAGLCWFLRNFTGLLLVREWACRAGAGRLARSAQFWRGINGVLACAWGLTGLFALLYIVANSRDRVLAILTAATGGAAVVGMCAATIANAIIAAGLAGACRRISRHQAAEAGPFLANADAEPVSAPPGADRV